MILTGPDTYTLSSGRTFYAHGGVLGFAPGEDSVSYGWDGGVEMRDWSAAEKRELADFMIALWQQYRDGVG